MTEMNLSQHELSDQNIGVNAVDTPAFIVDGLLVTGATSKRTVISGPVSTMLISCLRNLFQPGRKIGQRDSYQSVIINLTKTPISNKSQLRETAGKAAIAIQEATGFTVPSKLKKFSLNFLLQYHHVDKPDAAEYIKVTTLTSNDRHKFRLVTLILEQVARNQSLSSLPMYDEHTLDNLQINRIIPEIKLQESELFDTD